MNSSTAQPQRPRQRRSRESRERILKATEELLEGRLLEEIPIGDILRRARVSTGSFYNLFASRDDLVPLLYERYDRELTLRSMGILDPERWRTLGLEIRVGVLIRFATRFYRSRQGLMRALALNARAHPDDLSSEQRIHRRDLYDRIAALILERRNEITHPDPDTAVPLAILMVASTLREKILWSSAPHADAVSIGDTQLARQLSKAFLAYLGVRCT